MGWICVVDLLGELPTVGIILRILQRNKERHDLTSLLRGKFRQLGLKYVDAHVGKILEAQITRKLGSLRGMQWRLDSAQDRFHVRKTARLGVGHALLEHVRHPIVVLQDEPRNFSPFLGGKSLDLFDDFSGAHRAEYDTERLRPQAGSLR